MGEVADPVHGVMQQPFSRLHSNIRKVKRGNLERKLDFDTCCSGKICSKSKTIFV